MLDILKWLCVSLQRKVDVPNSVTFLNQTPIFEWYVMWCGSKNGSKKTRGWKKLDYVLNTNMTIFTMRMYKTFIRAPEVMRKVATASIWICWLSCANRVFHILWEVGLVGQNNHSRPHKDSAFMNESSSKKNHIGNKRASSQQQGLICFLSFSVHTFTKICKTMTPHWK